METLNVFLCAQLTGELCFNNGDLSFTYDTNYLNTNEAKKLSSALPLQAQIFKHQECHAFFSGLLPDEEIRRTLARYLQISETNIFGLLKAIGGECAGAVSLHRAKRNQKEGNNNSYKTLSNKEAQRLLLTLDTRPLLVGDKGVRMSAGGAQNKLMVSFIQGKLALPLYDSPSTHILKPAMKDFPDSVFNEFFCMKLAQELGLNTANAAIIWIEKQAYYLTERYDRVLAESGEIIRLHQEDFCQAMNIPPELKSENEGGPSLVQCKQLIDQKVAQGRMKGVSKIEFLKIIIFNYLIGNGDAHAKNFSLLYSGDEEALAPFYDLLSTMVYYNPYKSKMAMKLGGTYKFRTVGLSNFQKLASHLDIKFSLIEKQINYFKKQILPKAQTLAKAFNQDSKTQSEIYQKIIEVIELNLETLSS